MRIIVPLQAGPRAQVTQRQAIIRPTQIAPPTGPLQAYLQAQVLHIRHPVIRPTRIVPPMESLQAYPRVQVYHHHQVITHPMEIVPLAGPF